MCNGYYVPMRMFFYIGLVLLGLSFVTAAAENASHAMPGTTRSFIVPAYDLWYTFWPKSLLVFELKIERLFGNWMWDPVLVSILKLPAWLILGGPGVIILLLSLPKRTEDHQAEMTEAVESLELYVELTRQALKENPPGEEHGPQDSMPEDSFSESDPIDPVHPTNAMDGSNPFLNSGNKN